MIDSLPERALSSGEVEALRQQDAVSRLEPMLEFDGKTSSLVVEIRGSCYGLHSDHDTGVWEKVAEGGDFEQVVAEHEDWLDSEIESTVG